MKENKRLMTRYFKNFALVFVAATALAATASPPQQFDREGLETVEDLSESLANDLLELSVNLRDRDLEAVGRFFADSVTTNRLPHTATSTTDEVKWVRRHGWQQSTKQETISRADFLKDVGSLANHFSELEDVRFKVKGATFDQSSISNRTPTASARVFFFIIGRDLEGHREWLTGWSDVEAVRDGVAAEDADGEKSWTIRRITFEPLESKVATEDLFSEIAVPAKVAALFPPFGTEPNEGFVFHGAAAGDVNNDGLMDVVATGVESNYLYLNTGNGDFRDASEESMVAFSPPGSSPLLIDFDNDGDLDLFLATVGPQALLENRLIPDGELQFWDASGPAKVGKFAVGFSAAAADVDGNGHTDIYVASYNRYGSVMPNSWGKATNGTPNLLFLNQGDGTFREAGEEWGVNDGRWTYAASFADVDADGDPDLYVANDFGENGYYRNDGTRFVEAAEAQGIKDPGFGMGISFGDYNNDGWLDLHVTNMSSTAGNRILKRLYPDAKPGTGLLTKLAAGNSLYRNDGEGMFEDVTAEVGGFSAGWAFGGGFIDFDNDGWEDVYTPNGFISGKSMKDT